MSRARESFCGTVGKKSLPLTLIIRLLTYQKLTVMTTNENFKKDVKSLVQGWVKMGQTFDVDFVERIIERIGHNTSEQHEDTVTCIDIIREHVGISYEDVRVRVMVLLKMHGLR